jgi:hypothetical protein
MAKQSIPVLIALKVGQEDGLLRGGLDYWDQANKNNGAGAVYVAICSGSIIKWFPDGHGEPDKSVQPDPPKNLWKPEHQIIYDGSTTALCEPPYDWINDTGQTLPGFAILCKRTDVNPS